MTAKRRLNLGLIEHRYDWRVPISPARKRNIARAAINSPLFALAQHTKGFSHEWHSFSRLNRCYWFLGPMAFAWLWQEPLMNWVSA